MSAAKTAKHARRTPAHVAADRRGWVTVFNGARDHFQVPLALAEVGLLDTHVTDWYSPLDRPGMARLARRLPAGMQALLARRHAPGLPSCRVRSVPSTYLEQVLRPGMIASVDARLGVRAGLLARARGAGLFSYSYYGAAAFRAFGDAPGPRVLFQVHPHPASVRALLRDEMARVPAATSLADEPDVRAGSEWFDALCAESRMAGLCIAASRYTAHTLVENGIPPDRVRVVPYGVELPAEVPEHRPDRYRVLFLGQMVQRKGLSYLLEAWERLALRDAELVVAGRGLRDGALLARVPAGVRVESHVSRARLDELYATSDVLCVPSLAEGFGLVYLEAMARGVPVIGTVHTGAADVVTPGKDGFVLPIRDAGAIAARLRWGYEHRDALAAMRPCARRTAERYSWAAFRRNVRAALPEVGAGHALDPR